MFISRRRRVRNGFDADAQAFFTAAGITDASQKSAWNTAVIALKAGGFWSEIDRIYPMIGPNSASARYCAKTRTQMTAVNNPSYNIATGFTFDGGSQYLNPVFNPSNTPGSHWLDDAGHIGVSFSTTTFSSFGVPIGGRNADGTLAVYMSYLSTTEFHVGIGPDTSTLAEVADTGGYYSGTRAGTTTVFWHENETELVIDTTSPSFSITNSDIIIGGLWDEGFLSVDPYWVGAPICTAVIAGLINDTPALAAIINNFNNALGRFPG